MERVFVFDIDGTLTPSRQRMTEEFTEFFLPFCKKHNVYLVTGSDYAKVLEQVPKRVLVLVKGVFTCAGNQYYENGTLLHGKRVTFPEELYSFLEEKITHTEYHTKTGNHIEVRPSLLNFSTVGRNCTQKQREEYCHWDLGSGERKALRDEVKQRFPELDCTIGGEISIDIYPVGCDKSQAITFIRDRHGISPISFFGDKLHHGGNDFPVYSVLNTKERRRYAIPLDIVVPVKEWEETMENLKNI